MTVKDVMTREVETAVPDMPLNEAARRMRVFDVGMLVVYDGTTVRGVVTDRDIVVRACANGGDIRGQTVELIMSHPVKTVRDDETVDACARKMEEGRVRRLVVMDRAGALAGVVSLGDIAVRGPRELACDAFDRIVEST